MSSNLCDVPADHNVHSLFSQCVYMLSARAAQSFVYSYSITVNSSYDINFKSKQFLRVQYIAIVPFNPCKISVNSEPDN